MYQSKDNPHNFLSLPELCRTGITYEFIIDYEKCDQLTPIAYLIGHFESGDYGLDGGDLAFVEEDEGVLVLHLEEIIDHDWS